jgi:hypothetical protein
MYRGYTRHGIPYQSEDNSWKFEDGMLTTDGCFSRHHHTREEEEQDSYRHQPLSLQRYERVDGTHHYDTPYRDMYETFKYFQQMYQFKEIFEGVVVGQLCDNIGQS